ncbi:hypothetical protein ENROMA047B_15800 [Enterobacter rongchengensis]
MLPFAFAVSRERVAISCVWFVASRTATVPFSMAARVVPSALPLLSAPTSRLLAMFPANCPAMLPPVLMPALWCSTSYSAVLWISRQPSVPVSRRLLSAVAVEAITAPSSCVWPPTVMSNPPEPAKMPVCSFTEA